MPQEEQDPIRTFDKMVKQPLTYIDLNNALRVIVLEEIPARKIFNQKQVDVMKEFFATVLHYFPFNNENVRRLFKRLNNWLANKQGGLTTVRYQGNLSKLRENLILRFFTYYRGCKDQ